MRQKRSPGGSSATFFWASGLMVRAGWASKASGRKKAAIAKARRLIRVSSWGLTSGPSLGPDSREVPTKHLSFGYGYANAAQDRRVVGRSHDQRAGPRQRNGAR